MPESETSAQAGKNFEIEALLHGELTVDGRLPWSSNYTFLLTVSHEGRESKAIYKPEDGEQPLWDFPPGLYRREVAAYELAQALGWPNVPETVVREEAPFGIGSLQRFVPTDFEQHYFTMLENEELHDALQTIGTFDIVANNADRKGGHCLLGEDGNIWCIDHGVCFNEEDKLRTVIWEFETEAIPELLLPDIERVANDMPAVIAELLDAAEVEAMQTRMLTLLAHPVFPEVVTQRQYPWPLI